MSKEKSSQKNDEITSYRQYLERFLKKTADANVTLDNDPAKVGSELAAQTIANIKKTSSQKK